MKRLGNVGLVVFAIGVILFAASPVINFNQPVGIQNAYADPNNCSLPSGTCQAATFNGQNLTILDGGSIRGNLQVGGNTAVTGNLTVAGVINGVSGGDSFQLPLNFTLPDAGVISTASVGGSTVLGLKISTPGSVYLSGTSNQDGAAVTIQQTNTASGISSTFAILAPDGGAMVSLGNSSGVFVSNFAGPITAQGAVTASPATTLTQLVTLGQFDAGFNGTIPGKASGLAPNSSSAGTVTITDPGGTTDFMHMLYPDAGIAVQIYYEGTIVTQGGVIAATGTLGNSSTFPAGSLNVAGQLNMEGKGVTFVDTSFAGRAALYLNGSNILSVLDGSDDTTGGNPAELALADATSATHAASLGQVRALESTLFSVSPNAILVSAAPIGGHKLGALAYTVAAISGYKSVAVGGTGSVNILLTDGTSSCSIAIPCNTTGTFRVAGTGTCTFAALAPITGTVSGITGTCSILPTVLNLYVIGHY